MTSLISEKQLFLMFISKKKKWESNELILFIIF